MNKLFYNNKEISRDNDLSIYEFDFLDNESNTHLKKKSYKKLVEEKIELRYSIKDELAIQRQKDEKPEEYAEYYAYAEQCKAEAKKLLSEEV